MPEVNDITDANRAGGDSPAGQRQLFEELLEELSVRLALVFESMAGEKPAFEVLRTAPEPMPGAVSSLSWKQPLSGLGGALWLTTSEADWTAIGTHILKAAGLGPEDIDTESVRSSYTETLSQALGGLAQNLSARLGREVTPVNGSAAKAEDQPAKPTVWGQLRLKLGETPVAVSVGFEAGLLNAIDEFVRDKHQLATGLVATSAPASASGSSNDLHLDAEHLTALSVAGKSKTFDLLLDVELPVSVSFGSAEVTLRDALKLTTGSIVELNRTIQEPVEVVVNNCVIARGEVVVVEGNFGVRIQSVASRQDRLKTIR